MSWKIQYSETARNNLRELTVYIRDVLCAPVSSKKITKKILSSIKNLENFPEKYKLYQEEPWKSQGIRYFHVDNYIVIYSINQNSGIIYIHLILYGGMDISNQLLKNTVQKPD